MITCLYKLHRSLLGETTYRMDHDSPVPRKSRLSRSSFPSAFTFGTATSAYQIEGAVTQDGRGLCIWDSFTHIQGHIKDGTTADVACNSYNMYQDDIKLMVDMGVDAYRFSISWSRLFSDDIDILNKKGVAYYNKLINNLLINGIEPYVTLYHWDLPQVLENDINIKGWRTKEIVQHYARYAETCFKMFGDRVKHWITFNEIQVFSLEGYGYGVFPPGRSENSSTEPYIVTHNVLLAHAAVSKIYKEKYQADQGGRIGITCNSFWYEPLTQSKMDVDAAERCLDFELGWILDPIMKGHYPESMRLRVGNRLPCFSARESLELQGSADFIGINYYTSNFAKYPEDAENPLSDGYITDRFATLTAYGRDGELIGELMGPTNGTGWVYNCPWGLPKLLGWITARYSKDGIKNVPIIITENGACDDDGDLPLPAALADYKRIKYMSDTLQHLADCIKERQYNVEGYFVWSLLDNFEWAYGFSSRFGLHHVDFKNNQKRRPKLSASWYRDFLNPGSLTLDEPVLLNGGSWSFVEFMNRFLRVPLIT